MTIDRLRSAVKAEPFRPFVLRTADGREYAVRHPDFVLISPKAERTFVIYNASGKDPEDYVILDLLLVTAIEYLSSTKRNSKSGGTKRKKAG